MHLPRPLVPVLVGLVALIALAGCGKATAPPAPTPADFPGIADQLSTVGIKVANVVSGDAGCPDLGLARTAIGFDASGLDQPTPVRIRLYIFRDHEAWQRLSASVATCAQSYVTDPATYESLAPSPFVVSGQGPWAPGFAGALEKAFTEAAGTGG